MHPSPSALTTMTTSDLLAYRAEIHEAHMTRYDPHWAYQERKNLIDAIVADRKPNRLGAIHA